MLTAILKIPNKGGKILPENNAFGDKYNATGKLFYMELIALLSLKH